MIVIETTTATPNGDLEILAIVSIAWRRLRLTADVGLSVTALGIDDLPIVVVIITTILLASPTMPSSIVIANVNPVVLSSNYVNYCPLMESFLVTRTHISPHTRTRHALPSVQPQYSLIYSFRLFYDIP